MNQLVATLSQNPPESASLDRLVTPLGNAKLKVLARLEGQLNYCDVLGTAPREEEMLLRYPKSESDRAITRIAIENDFTHSGAFAAGLGYRLRSVAEQATFMDRLNDLNLNGLRHLASGSDYLLLPFVHGTSLAEFLTTASPSSAQEVLVKVLENMSRAHRSGVIYGDRWCANTMVRNDGGTLEIDFDIEIVGPHSLAASFENAQTIYHALHFGAQLRPFLAPWIGDRIREFQQVHDWDSTLVSKFVGNFARFYWHQFKSAHTLLEGIVPPSPDEILPACTA